uniref:UPF0160 protein MYG1, mitochondrial n=1 Tax=Magallana gigas TaxID=29159 RepID=K1PVU6_MAGGI
MKMVGAEFLDKVLYYKKSWLPARELVEEAVKGRTEVDPSGEIVVFKTGGCPWKDHLFNLEAELDINPPIKYVLYTDQANKWRIQCVPESLVSFSNSIMPLSKNGSPPNFSNFSLSFCEGKFHK